MGQGEVIKFLEKCDKPMSIKQIAEEMGENKIRIFHTMASLLKWKEVDFIEYTCDEIKKIPGYNSGRRTRFYFIKKNK